MKRGLWSALVGACAMAFASTLPATTATVNYTDLWWNSPAGSESGWGVNMSQQGTTLFMTFYVYGQDAKPTWIFALLRKTGETPSGQPIFTGETDVSTGAWYGGNWGTPPFSPRTAGSITFVPKDAVSGTLTYDVDGTRVTKSIQRETFIYENVSGSYLMTWRMTIACPATGTQTLEFTNVGTITQTDTAFALQETDDVGNVCTWTGTWGQDGALGSVRGALNCADGTNGSFTMSEIASSPIALNGRLAASGTVNLPPPAACTVNGTFSALRR